MLEDQMEIIKIIYNDNLNSVVEPSSRDNWGLNQCTTDRVIDFNQCKI